MFLGLGSWDILGTYYLFVQEVGATHKIEKKGYPLDHSGRESLWVCFFFFFFFSLCQTEKNPGSVRFSPHITDVVRSFHG